MPVSPRGGKLGAIMANCQPLGVCLYDKAFLPSGDDRAIVDPKSNFSRAAPLDGGGYIDVTCCKKRAAHINNAQQRGENEKGGGEEWWSVVEDVEDRGEGCLCRDRRPKTALIPD